jgi:nitrate reductase alpha subunit
MDMMKNKRLMRIKPTSEYPSEWDDLIGPNKKVIATIYTPEEGKKDNLKPGITKGKDGIYDIVVHAKEINNEVARNALRNLEKVTGKQYIFVSTTSSEDRIINYAERLMRSLKKYGNPDEGYDFSRARTSRQTP